MVKREGSFSRRMAADWRERFIRAFDAEFQAWLAAAANGTATGPSGWDGYAATVVSDAALEAQRTGAWTTVQLRDRPALYAR